MREALSGLVAAIAAMQALAGSPAAAVSTAYADVQKLPADVRTHVRYLSVYAIPEGQRGEFLKTLAFHVNSLSREGDFALPVNVGGDVLRIDLRDFGWDRAVFDRLPDPYFLDLQHPVEGGYREVEQEYGHFEEGKTKGGWPQPKVWVTTKHVKERVKADAPAYFPMGSWTGPDAAALVEATGIYVPIVRADWFIFQTGIERAATKASYAEFLGLGNKEQDFLDLIAADPEKSRKVKKEIAGVMARSGVAINARRIVRLQSITGAYYFTQDFKTSIGKQNVLRFLDNDTEPPEGDASEQYGTLPNGLFAYWLQNAKGVRQDVVPPDIALDSHTISNDRNIYLGIKSCASCHTPGIQPINDYARKIFTGAIKLQSVDYERFKRLRQFYLSDLEGQVKVDNDFYARSLLRLNGLTPQKNAAAYEAAWNQYAETDLTPGAAALELGCTPEQFLAALKAYSKATGALDTVLASFIQEPAVPVRREQWEESFGLANEILRGTRP